MFNINHTYYYNSLSIRIKISNIYSNVGYPYEIKVHESLDCDRAINFLKVITGIEGIDYSSVDYRGFKLVNCMFSKEHTIAFKNFMLDEVEEKQIAFSEFKNVFR